MYEAKPTPTQSEFSKALYSALRSRTTILPLSSRGLPLDIDDAYAISLGFLELRLADGERIVGKKIGVTSKAVQDMLGVHQPDFGFLTDRMEVADGASVSLRAHGLIQPRAEAEIAFVLRKDLVGPGVTDAMVLDATEAVAPCFEIVDSRIQDWKIGIVDTVADNASCGVYALGKDRIDPRTRDLASLQVKVFKNGEFLSEGLGSAVQGSPLTAVAWLANTIGRYGVPLKAGEVILSGSLVPLEPAKPGDRFEATLAGVGRVSLSFTQ
jgi:2-oxopent-4-enoate/cis-2-oxohex-4-enoate hydratase